jgi:hypothetical protein
VNHFNEAEWSEKIKSHTWYFDVPIAMKKLMDLREKNNESYLKTKEQIYNFFDRELEQGNISLGTEGKDFDSERKDIDAVVIHHTHGEKPMTNSMLSAMTLVRLYATYYANPAESEKELKGKPIYSGHFREGKQVFYPYHWIVRRDGSIERMLFDNEIGWQAGNWGVNCRSIAIALDNDYENSVPSKEEIESITQIIKENYSNVSKESILGHREINLKTTCPSNLFLSKEGIKGWKEDIFALL